MSASKFASRGIIAFHAAYLDLDGVDHLAALFMSQCVYWQGVQDRSGGGHWWHSLEQWAVELRVTRRQLDHARKVWRAHGVLIEGRRGQFDNTKTYRVDFERLDALLRRASPPDRSARNGTLHEVHESVHIDGHANGHILTETTDSEIPQRDSESRTDSVIPNGGTPHDTDTEALHSANGVDQIDLDKLLYLRGKALLGEKSGGQITKLKNAIGTAAALDVIETARRKENPAEYIAGTIRKNAEPEYGLLQYSRY